MHKKILLIEPPYRSVFLPLGLQKIAAYHLQKKDEVKFIHDYPNFGMVDNTTFDIIYITSLFTYHGRKVLKCIKMCQEQFPNAKIKVGGIFASLMPDLIKNQTGISPHIGMWKEIDTLIPDYSVFPKTNQAIIFTTRGCPHKCKFCAVKTLEPDYYVIDSWRDQINTAYDNGIRHFVVQDNNFLVAPWDHQKAVVKLLSQKEGITVDFGGGLDARMFEEKHAKLLSVLKFTHMRFAFDGMYIKKDFIRAMTISKKYIKPKHNYMIYTLYNWMDKPEDLYERIKIIETFGATAYPMKFSPLDSIEKTYVGKHWTKDKLKNLRTIMGESSTYITIIREAKWLGKDINEYLKRLNGNITLSSKKEYKKIVNHNIQEDIFGTDLSNTVQKGSKKIKIKSPQSTIKEYK